MNTVTFQFIKWAFVSAILFNGTLFYCHCILFEHMHSKQKEREVHIHVRKSQIILLKLKLVHRIQSHYKEPTFGFH